MRAPVRYVFLDIELSRPLPTVAPGPAERALGLLVRRDGVPLRFLLLALAPGVELTGEELGRLVADATRLDLVRAALVDELVPACGARSTPLTVCVCADGPPDRLHACLERVLTLAPGDGVPALVPGDVMVVAPASADEVVRAFPGVRRVRDEQAALHEAGSEHVAFLTAGALPDAGWLAGVADALARHPDAAAVTGPLVPLELATRTQLARERRAAQRRDFTELRWEGERIPAAALSPSGAHAQVVVRCEAVAAVGGMTPEWELLVWRLLRHGQAVVDAPRVLAFHRYDRPRGALRRRCRRWGAGVAGAAVADPELRRVAARRIARELRATRPSDADLVLAGIAGGLAALPGSFRRPSRLTPTAGIAAFAPVDVLHLDLAAGLSPLNGQRGAFAVLWWGNVPLGHLELTPSQRTQLRAIAPRLARAIAPAVGERLFATGFERPAPSRFPQPPGPAPPLDALLALRAPLARLADVTDSTRGGVPEDPAHVSVVICTRRRPDELARCLDSLARLDVPPRETLVVDNDPGDGVTANVVARFPGVVHVPEPRPGLSVARNTGIRAAAGRVIAFVDDDALVHPSWLQRLLSGFAGPEVLAVTGLVLPAELETRAQAVFEATMGSAGRGYRRMTFGHSFFAPQKALGAPVWTIGAGVNMALRREAFERLGLFDERLGAGAAGCSEDSELWYRILAAGGECRYQPDAVVLHRHRREGTELRCQAHDYLRGHVAALYVQFARHRHPGNLRRALVTLPTHLLRRALRELVTAPDARPGTLGAEVAGYLAGMAMWPLALSLRPGRRALGGAQRLPAKMPPRRVASPTYPAAPAPPGR